ncbi:hypothetical protein ALT721_440100 [Alteromonas alvinellae]
MKTSVIKTDAIKTKLANEGFKFNERGNFKVSSLVYYLQHKITFKT